VQGNETTTIFVCTACRQSEDAEMRPGETFIAALRERMPSEDEGRIFVTAVDCLGVCRRPCTVALSAAGKWTYVLGDLDMAAGHVEQLVAAAKAYAACETGIVPWKERPTCFKKGVVSRTPPLGSS
jgi:predicted metal-binding protein